MQIAKGSPSVVPSAEMSALPPITNSRAGAQ